MRSTYQKSANPLFSIVVPVYNGESLLDECLSSILTQSFSDFEVILVDDGSTDESPGICDSYAAKYPGTVRAIHEKNQGIFRARFNGYLAAKGQYMVSSDQDDLLSPHLLERVAAVIGGFDPDLIIFNFDRIDLSGRRAGTPREHIFPEGRVAKEEWFYRYLLGDATSGLWSRVFKKELYDFDYLKDKEIFNLDEDFPQCIRIGLKAKSIYYLDEVLYHWRVNTSSVSHSFNGIEPYALLCPDIRTTEETLKELKLSDERLAAAEKRYDLNSVWKAAARVMRSERTGSEKRDVLTKIRSFEEVERLRPYLDMDDRLPQRKLGLKLFYGGHYRMLGLLCGAISLIKRVSGRKGQ